ncbi:hypothetical protein [Flavobacterium subsaxonicum]|uniref:Lipoprotein n=1 Tax=Flavobacterium subsaxonicum WB 4.1-42 = DSM 21790 TaxID=1121898 RepID=A0A0A2MJD6_9FLAO|nr:hypothetical protein [Flavobacterium subsaxonicum]KGO92419.1 hypothetical protein Q766_13255 [Flavobacterium subsaxonicum WB 4.1-42 = DSM 21790]
MKTAYLLLPLLALFLGCSPAATNTPPATFDASSNKGLAIGTLTFEADVPVNDIYRFFYEAQSGDKSFKKQNSGKIVIKARENNTSAFNGDFNNKKTYLIVLERDPGNYAFTQYSFLDHIGSNGMVSDSKKFGIPFEVKKGEITYFGELSYLDQAQKGTPRIYVAGYKDRDIAEFKRKFPSIDWDKAIDRTPKTGNNGEGIIDFR